MRGKMGHENRLLSRHPQMTTTLIGNWQQCSRKPIPLGANASRRCIVLASRPVALLRRFAARSGVGTKSQDCPLTVLALVVLVLNLTIGKGHVFEAYCIWLFCIRA